MKIGQITKKGVHSRSFPYSSNTGSAYHWTYVMRADKKYRLLIAEGMENAIKKKKKIKYSNGSKCCQLYDDVKPKFDVSKLNKKSYVNCSVLASICCRYAGLKTPRRSSSLTLHKKWTGFKRIKYKKGMTLYRGDVLVSTTRPKPHTAVVL